MPHTVVGGEDKWRVPEFVAALELMGEGAISAALVETRYGIHPIRLDARVRGEVLPFTAVLPHLR